MEGGTLFYGVEDLREVADAAGGEGFDGTGGDGVDSDVLGSERGGEVADGGFERGLGYAHDVVVGEDLGRAVVGEGDDGTALGHEGSGRAGDGDERVDADVVGDAEAFAAGEEEVVLDLVGGGEGYGVDYGVDGAVGLFDDGEEGVDLGVAGDVALVSSGGGEGGGELFGVALESFVLVADGECRASLGEFLGNAPGDAALVGEAEDDGDFAFEINHVAIDSFRRCEVRIAVGGGWGC